MLFSRKNIYVPIVILTLYLSACLPFSNKSELGSFNSKIETDEPSVFYLENAAGGVCTQIAYHPEYAITAAHCVMSADRVTAVTPDLLSVRFPDGRSFKALELQVAAYAKKSSDGLSVELDYRNDLAIIKYPKIFKDISALEKQRLQPSSDRIKIVGFGVRGYFNQDAFSLIFNSALSSEAFRDALKYQDQVAQNSYAALRREDLALGLGEKKFDPSNPTHQMLQRIQELYRKIQLSTLDEKKDPIKRSGTNSFSYSGGLSFNEPQQSGAGDSADVKTGTNFLIMKTDLTNLPFKDAKDKEIFDLLNIYAPDEAGGDKKNTEEPAEREVATSFGDSGGPAFAEQGRGLVGIASHVAYNPNNKKYYSVYVSLNNHPFLTSLPQAKGWPVPVDSPPPVDDFQLPAPSRDEQKNIDPGKQINPSLGSALSFAALADESTGVSSYKIFISAQEKMKTMWLCPGGDLNACAYRDDQGLANKITAYQLSLFLPDSQKAPSGRAYFVTNSEINFGMSSNFSLISVDSEGVLYGDLYEIKPSQSGKGSDQ